MGAPRAALLAAVLAGIAPRASALDAPTWPPPPGTEARMRELQHVLIDRASSPAQREVAREELSALLKSPAGRLRGRTPGEKPARAAIDPLPSVVKPAAPLVTPGAVPPEVAHVEVIVPPKPARVLPSGAAAVPSAGFAIDPRTGAVLHPIPGGYIDPRTGQVTH